MSLYIVARKPGEIPMLLRVRAFSTDIGLDAAGRLSMSAPHTPLFSIIRHEDRYTIRAAASGIAIGESELRPGGCTGIFGQEPIHCAGYEMRVHAGTADIESRSISGATYEDAVLGHIETSVAGLRQRFPLFLGEFTVGSSDEDSLHLPLHGVAPRHLSATVSEGFIEVVRGNGTISIETDEGEMRLIERVTLTSRTAFRIQPGGILIILEPGSAG